MGPDILPSRPITTVFCLLFFFSHVPKAAVNLTMSIGVKAPPGDPPIVPRIPDIDLIKATNFGFGANIAKCDETLRAGEGSGDGAESILTYICSHLQPLGGDTMKYLSGMTAHGIRQLKGNPLPCQLRLSCCPGDFRPVCTRGRGGVWSREAPIILEPVLR